MKPAHQVVAAFGNLPLSFSTAALAQEDRDALMRLLSQWSALACALAEEVDILRAQTLADANRIRTDGKGS